jgi:cell wall-associated NlpC family hydrolase
VPTIKAEPVGMLFLSTGVRVEGEEGVFARLSSGLFIERTHLAPVGDAAADFVAEAEMFHHAPYLWGGNTVQGIDCSGLVQMTMWRAGHAVLRDADMQEMTIGAAVDAEGALQRGDLVFWRGHVGIMTGPKTILHATEYTLRVVEEDFPAMRARLAGIGLDVTSVKRP